MAHPCLRFALVGAMLTTLGACGGGGGGSSGPAPVPPPSPINGDCGTPVTLNQCAAGTFADTTDTDTEHLWNCSGSNGGSTAMCSLPKPIDGECGEELNICLVGDLKDIDDTDTDFLWDCDGLHGGEIAMCSLPKPIDGTCGEELNICLTGNLDDIDDTDTDNLWNCDGEHGGEIAMCSLPKPRVVCPNGAPAADNPLLCERGGSSYRSWVDDYPVILPGIDQLPLDRVQLTNEEVQQHFAILEFESNHARDVGATACESYVTASEQCELHENRAGITRHPEGDEETSTGLIPFTQMLDSADPGTNFWGNEQIDAMQDLRILNASQSPSLGYLGDADRSYLHIRSAGNGASNHSWFLDGYLSDKEKDVFIRAIAANKLLFVAGVIHDVNGNYIRHPDSSSCKDVDDGCLWTWFEFTIEFSGVWHRLAGTSFSTPNIAASLASVLSIFPDTEHQDLAKLARACAKKTGEGIDGPDGLLATSGGFGVADFSCMDEITTASADLSANETVTLTIDGREVVVSSRSITVTEPDS